MGSGIVRYGTVTEDRIECSDGCYWIVFKRNGKFHHLTEPACKKYGVYAGHLLQESWYIDGKLNRTDLSKPYNVEYYTTDKKVKREDYFVYNNDVEEKETKMITYYENGNVNEIIWYISDTVHHFYGPAHIQYNYDGTERFKKYYLYGQEQKKCTDAPIIIKLN